MILALMVCQIPLATTPAMAAAAAPTVLTTCTYAGLKAAVQKGGAVVFACKGTISFTSPITVTKAVTIDASGYSVTLDGQSQSQIFRVTSGSLTLVNLTLTNASVTGGAGKKGTAGNSGTVGTGGTEGTDGTDGTAANRDGTDGSDGTEGTDGTDGTNAGAGGLGGPGQGGAIYVARGAQLVAALAALAP